MKQKSLSVLVCFSALATDYVLSQATQNAAFINEFHYDDYLSDSNEFVEVVVDTSQMSVDDIGGLLLYDGSNGLSYRSAPLAEATVVNDDTNQVAYIVWEIAGIQDGSADGIALYDSSDAIVEFISYEGSFMASDGLANGMVSTDIGYSESGSDNGGYSLQRIGVGTSETQNNGQWVFAKQTKGGANVLQNFGECIPIPVTTKADIQLNEIHYDDYLSDSNQFVEFIFKASSFSSEAIGGLVRYDGASGKSDFAIGRDDATVFYDPNDSNIGFLVWDLGLHDTAPSGFTLVDNCNSVVQFVSYEGSFIATEGLAKGMVSTDFGYSESGSGSETNSLQRIGVGFSETISENKWVLAKQTRGKANVLQTFGTCTAITAKDSILMNEIHYDDYLSDSNEFVEFVFELSAVPVSSIGGFVRYDGATGKSVYAISPTGLKFFFDPEDPNIGYVVVDTVLADGAPDGFALVDSCNNVVLFISYEGSFIGTEGVANGIVSRDIGRAESGNGRETDSLQRIGVGFAEVRADDQWVLAKQTKGKANVLQTFGACTPITVPDSVKLNEVHYDDYLSDSGEFVEFVFSLTEMSPSAIGGLVHYDGSTGKDTYVHEQARSILFFDPDDPTIGFAVWDTTLSDGPHGMAIVDTCNTVITFVSYEGSFTAASGVAKGLRSADIGISEDGRADGSTSLQLQSCLGSGEAEDWVVETATRGARNGQQDLQGCFDGVASVAPPATTSFPVAAPTSFPVAAPTSFPVAAPTSSPTSSPTKKTVTNSMAPTNSPTQKPTTKTVPPPFPSNAPVFVAVFPIVSQPPTKSNDFVDSSSSPTSKPVFLGGPEAQVPIETEYGRAVELPGVFSDDAESVEVVDEPENGVVTVDEDGTVVYTPEDGFAGVDTLQVQVCYAAGACTTTQYTINIAQSPPSKSKALFSLVAVVPLTAMVLLLYFWQKRKEPTAQSTAITTEEPEPPAAINAYAVVDDPPPPSSVPLPAQVMEDRLEPIGAHADPVQHPQSSASQVTEDIEDRQAGTKKSDADLPLTYKDNFRSRPSQHNGSSVAQ